jgi:hypothetical protein
MLKEDPKPMTIGLTRHEGVPPINELQKMLTDMRRERIQKYLNNTFIGPVEEWHHKMLQ